MKFAKRLAISGLVIMITASLPGLIYMVVGPADGNPIGLGVLMFLGVMVGQALLALAAMLALVLGVIRWLRTAG